MVAEAEPMVADAVAEPEPAVAEPEPEPAVAELEVASAEAASDEVEPEVMAAEREAAEPTYSPAVVEPDWFADGDFAWLDAADLGASSPSVVDAAEPAHLEAEPQPAEETAPEPISATEDDAASWAPQSESVIEPARPSMPDLPQMPDLPPALDLPAAPEPQVQHSLESELRPEMAQSVVELVEPIEAIQPQPAEFEAPDVGEPVETDGPTAAPTEEEVMWLGADRAATSEIEPASIPWPAESRSTVAIAAAPPLTKAEPPLLRMTEQELARLARDEGWDEAEVAAIRAMIVPPPSRSVQLPGAAELDDAMAALHAVPVEADEQPFSTREWAKPPSDTRSPTYDDWAFEVEPVAPPRPRVEPLAPRRQPPDPGWLRRRQGPAATAYRRLRRLFPG